MFHDVHEDCWWSGPSPALNWPRAGGSCRVQGHLTAAKTYDVPLFSCTRYARLKFCQREGQLCKFCLGVKSWMPRVVGNSSQTTVGAALSCCICSNGYHLFARTRPGWMEQGQSSPPRPLQGTLSAYFSRERAENAKREQDAALVQHFHHRSKSSNTLAILRRWLFLMRLRQFNTFITDPNHQTHLRYCDV